MPSCRRTSRPPPCAVCASCRRCCCTGRTGPTVRPSISMPKPMRSCSSATRTGPSSTDSTTVPTARSRSMPARPPCRTARARRCRLRAIPTPGPAQEPTDGARLVAHRQPGLPGRGSAGGTARAAARTRIDHRLPRRRHRDRTLGTAPGHRRPGHPALRRIRCRADAVPGRARARTAPAVGAAQADLRLGQRAAVRFGCADGRRSGWPPVGWLDRWRCHGRS